MTTLIFKKLIVKETNELSSLEATKEKVPVFDLFSGLNETQAIEKTHKLTRFLLKFGYKIMRNHLENKNSAFIKLFLIHRKATLIKIFFNKLRKLLIKKSRESIYTFFNKVSRKGIFRWKTAKNFDEKAGPSLKNWDFSRKSIEIPEYNKIRKIVLDFSIAGDSPYGQNINSLVIKVFISHKYSIKILRLFLENIRKKLLFHSFSCLLSENSKKKPPKVLQEYLLGKTKEKEDFHRFLNKTEETSIKSHKTHEKTLRLHNQELNKITEKLDNSMKIPLKVRESLILSNWAGQILQRIMRFYRREFLNNSFNRIYRHYHREKYRRKVLLSLYEKYRSARIRDLTVKFIDWKVKSFDQEKYGKIRTLLLNIEKIVRKTKKSRFLELLMRISLENDGKFNRVSNKIKAFIGFFRVFERKSLILREKAFKRMKNEDFLEEMSQKLQSVDKINEISRKLAFRIAYEALKNHSLGQKRLETLSKRLDFIFKIRKVVFFYRILAFARINIKK